MFYLLGDYRDNSLDSRQWGPFRRRVCGVGAVHLAVTRFGQSSSVE